MTIHGAIPPGGAAQRVAQAYGVAKKLSAPPAASAAPVPAAAGEAGGLRSILTDEERSYFDQLAALGPISYGPGRRSAAPVDVPRGLRLDVTG